MQWSKSPLIPTIQISNSSRLLKHSDIIKIHLVMIVLGSMVLLALQCTFQMLVHYCDTSMKGTIRDDFFRHAL